MSQSLYVVRKYIMAESADEAIKLDKKHTVCDVWIDDEWRKNNFPVCEGFTKDNKS